MHSHLSQRILVTSLIAIALLAAAAAPLVRAADAKPKYTIKEVMKTLHKGDDNIAKHVTKGAGTKEEFAKLVEYYESLPLNTPEKGDKGSWEEKSMALLKASKALKAGEADALAGYKKAVNCKACHSVHKPD